MSEIRRYVLVDIDGEDVDGHEFERLDLAIGTARHLTDVAVVTRIYRADDTILAWAPRDLMAWPPRLPTMSMPTRSTN